MGQAVLSSWERRRGLSWAWKPDRPYCSLFKISTRHEPTGGSPNFLGLRLPMWLIGESSAGGGAA